MKKTILILDDDVQLAIQWAKTFESAGYNVFITHGAQEAHQVFSSNAINLCVVDFMVRRDSQPTADGGLSFLGTLSAAQRRSTKILGVSGMRPRGKGLDPKKYLTTFGAQHFLSKPFSDLELLEEVNVMLARGVGV